MRNQKKFVILLLAAALLVLSFAGCAAKTATSASTSAAASTPAASAPAASASASTSAAASASASQTTGEKPAIKFYGKCIEYTSGPMMTDALEKALADKYTIDSIQIDWSNMDTVIRTGIASNDPCDIYNYPASSMANFADMAVDLMPYLDADPEFKAYFSQAELDACTIDGKLVCLPWESNFSVILGNKEALDKIGVTIPDAWTMDEFNAACAKIKAAGLYPFTNATDLNRAAWIYRNAILSVAAAEGKSQDFTDGNISLGSDESKQALEATKALYDNGYMYPGEGAVTVKNDEAKAAFYQGKVLMMPEIAAGAKQTADGAADFTTVLIPWPSVSDKGAILGGMNCLFIPKNAKNIDAAVEVLKTYLSADIQKIHADQGYIPANVNVQVSDPFVQKVMAQAETFKAEPPYSSAVFDYLNNSLTADLVLNGGVDTVLQNLKTAESAG